MVTFERKKISSSSKRKNRSNRNTLKRLKGKSKVSKILLKILLIVIILTTIGIIVGGFIIYNKMIAPLPSIYKLKELSIPESSEIYDRDNNLLYSVFKEKRTYINYKDINSNMINAIVSGEDKRFWTNPGFDFIGILRSILEGIKNGGDFKGTSGISQQLIKNTFLTNEKSIERKIKEIYLSYRMTNAFTKETIIELYLNKISFGNNAYGIEQASKTYFGKSAKDLDILESSILASMPKGPTLYSPYRFFYNKEQLRYDGYPLLMGYPYVYSDKIKNNKDLIEKEKENIFPNIDNSNYIKEIEKLKEVINNLKFSKLGEESDKILICNLNKSNFKDSNTIDSDGCTIVGYSDLLGLLNNIRIKVGENYIEYQTGRKDFILGRMFEDGKLSTNKKLDLNWEESVENYKNGIINGILFEFKKSKTTLKYPHFVFYVKQFLEDKYGKSSIEEGGLKIYTTLDPTLQDRAEEIVKKYSKTNLVNFGSNNAATITIDNKNGEILTMVGGKDYQNKDIGGDNNIITSKLQPGSTFKPFVYALAMEQNKIGPKTPIFDVRTVFPGNYSPNNFDGRFQGKMTIAEALNHSRNIPAIKMFYLAGQENKIISFMRKLGVETYYKFKKEYREKNKTEYNYGAPMALGTGEMTPLELAGAYSTIASLGDKKEITPILKILDKDGNIIYSRERNQKTVKNSINPKTAYLITSILIDTTARPASWNTFMTLPGRPMASKTGTSTKQFKDKWGNKKIYPQNLWTIGYTPQYTTVSWAGNTNGKELYYKGNGLEGAGPITKDIMVEAHKGKKVEYWKMPSGIKEVVISKNSGHIPTSSTPANSKEKGLFINVPTQFDDSYFSKEVDSLCNGKVDEKTPKEAIKMVKGVRYHSLKPEWPNWENPVLRISGLGGDYKNEVCERTDKPSDMKIGISISNNGQLFEGANYVELAYRSTSPIIKIEIILDGKKIAYYDLPGKEEGVYKGSFNVPAGLSGNKILMVKVIDNQYYSETISKTVLLGGRDTTSPEIILENPAKGSISLKQNTQFNLRASFVDVSPIRIVNVYLNGKKIPTTLNGRSIVLPVSSEGLEIGKYNLKMDVIDIHFNKTSKIIPINIIE